MLILDGELILKFEIVLETFKLPLELSISWIPLFLYILILSKHSFLLP